MLARIQPSRLISLERAPSADADLPPRRIQRLPTSGEARSWIVRHSLEGVRAAQLSSEPSASGRAHFCFVADYLATNRVHIPSSRPVAIKQIDLEHADDDISEIQLEIAHLMDCDSQWVTRYYGSFVRGYKLWIIMEYLAGGSCLDLVSI